MFMGSTWNLWWFYGNNENSKNKTTDSKRKKERWTHEQYTKHKAQRTIPKEKKIKTKLKWNNFNF